MVDYSKLEELSEAFSSFYQAQASHQWGESFEYADAATDDFLAAKQRAKQLGLTEAGEGGDRLVFKATAGCSVVPNDCVVKFSKSDGTSQNQVEVEQWVNLPDEVRQYVAPVVEWHDNYQFVVQRFAKPTAGNAHEVAENLASVGWACSDIDGENVGKYNGEYVLRDLGVGLRQKT